MKVLIAIVLAIGSVSALGSGPYLPSGWRPQGPSFYLPSEVSNPSHNPLKENLLQETEASGSDALREYGPPKVEEVVQFSVNQGLPDVVTEQTFFVQSLATQDLQSSVQESAAVEDIDEILVKAENDKPIKYLDLAREIVDMIVGCGLSDSDTVLIVVTANGLIAKSLDQHLRRLDSGSGTSGHGPHCQEVLLSGALTAAGSLDSVPDTASTEQAAANIEEVASTTEALSEAQPTFEATPLEVVAEIVEQTSEAVQTEEATEEAVQEDNLALTVVNAEEEIVTPNAVAQDVTAVLEEAVVPTDAVLGEIVVPAAIFEQVVVERVAEEVNNIAETLVKLENEVNVAEALEAAVEIKTEVSGSLQKAPEGFLEYGPPKAEDIARSAAVQVAPTSSFENNEARRRRFSPKFKFGHKKH